MCSTYSNLYTTESKYLVLFGLEKYNSIYYRTRYLIGLKSSITYVFYSKIKIESDDDLSLEETLALHDVIILIKTVFNKNQNYYYYNIFLEKCSCQLANNYNKIFW